MAMFAVFTKSMNIGDLVKTSDLPKVTVCFARQFFRDFESLSSVRAFVTNKFEEYIFELIE